MSRVFQPVPAETPQERLIEATIAEIEERGLSQLTVRAVAARAEMNIAAVNYHFRSKQALVTAALDGTIRHLLEDTAQILAGHPSDPEGMFSELLSYYLEGSLRFPGVSKAHLHDAFIAGDYTGAFPKAFAPVLGEFGAALSAALPGIEPSQAARRVVAALSAVFFPAFFAGLYRGFADLDTPEARTRYVHELAQQLLAPLTPGSAQSSAKKKQSRAERQSGPEKQSRAVKRPGSKPRTSR